MGLAWAAPSNASSIEAGSSTLAGSHESMERQNQVARENDFTFLRNRRQVSALVEDGRLIPMFGDENYRLIGVSHPVARAVTKTFVERLGVDYHEYCGAPLIVTSLTRPLSEQPRNASELSVHPAGMATDLRVPSSYNCRRWLETTLLSLERKGVLDVTREYRPAHYHVAIFPEAYSSYIGPIIAEETAAAESAARSARLAATINAAAAAAVATVPQLPAKTEVANIGPGPGPLTTLLYAVIVLSGMTALLIAVRGPTAVRVDSGERRRSEDGAA